MDVNIEMSKTGRAYFRLYGLWFKVQALIIEEHVNTFLEHNTDFGVLATNGEYAVISEITDGGVEKLPKI